MTPNPERRTVLALLTSHWLTMTGVALVTLAGIAWLFALPLTMRGHVTNPYIGLLLFIALPALFFAGLILIPIGIYLSRKRVMTREMTWRRAWMFFAIMTPLNIIIGSQLSYRALQHMDTVQFCGQTCHVMKPEFTAHKVEPHTAVACAGCHIAPGAEGWLKAKMNGTSQLIDVVMNDYPRPIPSAMESHKLVSSRLTCEQCHDRYKVAGQRLQVLTHYKDDETNSRTQTVLMMNIGGGNTGGIHDAHMGPGVSIRYAALDAKRQNIPWVEYRKGGTVKTFVSADAKPGSVDNLPKMEMQCVDCHNRAAHAFELAGDAIDDAIESGRISAKLPYVKKTGMALLQPQYASQEEASKNIESGLCDYGSTAEFVGKPQV